jgi:prepilin-type N-terminal cleavage/methylation domain-containing protein
MGRLMVKRSGTRHAGFTLVEIAVVIIVLGFLLAMIAGIATAVIGQQRRESTRQRLAGVETAITLFVSQNKRLPCPADGRIAGTTAGSGIEARVGVSCQTIGGTANSQTHGVVPWVTLGLAEPDVTDGWGGRFTYRAAPELVGDSAMDLTACDPGGSFGLAGTPLDRCNQAGTLATDCNSTSYPGRCTPPSAYTQGRGLKVRNNMTAAVIMDPNPATPPSTGAAYVVISHGENRQGAYNSEGTISAAGNPASGSQEVFNAADAAFVYSLSSAAVTAGKIFVDDFPRFAADTDHFDDSVLRPTILTVATKAQLGPRAH